MEENSKKCEGKTRKREEEKAEKERLDKIKLENLKTNKRRPKVLKGERSMKFREKNGKENP